MGLVVVLGGAAQVNGFALGGATVIPAEYPDAVRRAWNLLPEDVAVVVLTHEAAAVMGVDAAKREGVITVVMPP